MTNSDEVSLGKKVFNAMVFGAAGGSVVAFNKTYNHSVFVDNPKSFINASKSVYRNAVGGGIVACVAYTATKHTMEEIRGKNDYLNNTVASVATAFCLGVLTNSLKTGVKSGLLLIPLSIGAQMINDEMNSSKKLLDGRFDSAGKSKLVIHNYSEELKSKNN